MKQKRKCRLCLLVVLCMAALFLPQGLAAQEQPETPTDLTEETAAPAQQNQSAPAAASYSGEEYSQGDVGVINAIIQNNGLVAEKDKPKDWEFVTWGDTGKPKRITKLNLSIQDLSGTLKVSGLEALRTLDCSSNKLTGLDVRNLPALTELKCYDNQLTGLKVSNLPALTELYCFTNELTGLDVRGLDALQRLDCYNNELTGLNVSGLDALWYLDCNNNQLTGLDVRDLDALQILYCNNNQLSELNVRGFEKLRYLDCSFNQLTSLELKDLPVLDDLTCNNNQLTSLELTDLPVLDDLTCNNNQLTSLKVSNLSALTSLNCSNNQLTGLDVRGMATNIVVDCNRNSITQFIDPKGNRLTFGEAENGIAGILFYHGNDRTVRVKAYPKAGYAFQKWDDETTDNPYTFELNGRTTRTPVFMTEANPRYAQEDLAALQTFITGNQLDGYRGIRLDYPDTYWMAKWQADDDASTNKRLIKLDFWRAGLTGVMEVSGFKELLELKCNENELTGLKVSNLPALTDLDCFDNQLTSLKMSNLPALTGLGCSNNELTGLELTNLPVLKNLGCNNNQLTGLNVSGLPALTSLYCYDNQLTSLDASGLEKLQYFDFLGNPLTNLKLPGGKSIKIKVTGSGQPWLKSFGHYSDEGTYIAKPDPGYGGEWSDLVGCTKSGEGILFDISAADTISATLTFKRNASLSADPNQGEIKGGNGLQPGSNVQKGDTFTFTANPITTGAADPYDGDIQYMPESWSVNPSGNFKSGYTQEFSTKDMALGEHTLRVEYRKEWYDGRNWVYADEKIQKTFTFTLVEKIIPPDGNTSGGGQTVNQPGTNTDASSANPGTGDSSYAWYMIGLALAGGALLLLARKKKTD